jgi:hypothetical protein
MATLAPGLLFPRVGLGAPRLVTVLLTPCKTCQTANVFPAFCTPEKLASSKQVPRYLISDGTRLHRLRATPVEHLIALDLRCRGNPLREIGRASVQTAGVNAEPNCRTLPGIVLRPRKSPYQKRKEFAYAVPDSITARRNLDPCLRAL